MPQASIHPQTTPPANSPIARDAVFLLRKLGVTGSIDANSALEPLGLKVRSYSTLCLACTEPASTQKEIAEILSLDPSQIVAIVDQLEEAKLVTRTPSAKDRRTKIITATAAGKKLMTKAQKEVTKAQQETLSTLSEAEIETLTSLLARAVLNPR